MDRRVILNHYILVGGRTVDTQLERRTRIAAQVLAHIAVVLLGHVLTIDGKDDVALLQARLCRRLILVRLVDAHPSELIVVADERADTRILTHEHHLHVTALVLRIVLRVRVKAPEHGIDAIAHGLIGIERVDIQHVEVLVDRIEDLQVLGHIEVVVIRLRSHRRILSAGRDAHE